MAAWVALATAVAGFITPIIAIAGHTHN